MLGAVDISTVPGKISTLPMPGSPGTSWVGPGLLLVITGLIGLDTMTAPDGSVFHLGLWTLCAVPVLALLLWLGWQFVTTNEPRNALFR